MEGPGVDIGEQAMSGTSSGTRASYCTYKVQTCCGYSEVEEDTKGLRVRHRGLLLLGLCLWWHFSPLFVRLSSKTRLLAMLWQRRLKAQQRALGVERVSLSESCLVCLRPVLLPVLCTRVALLVAG